MMKKSGRIGRDLMMSYKKYDIILVNYDPSVGTEITKTRPSIVISSNIYNKLSNQVIVAPITSVIRKWGTRIDIDTKNTKGQIALDQMRSISSTRIVKKLENLKDEDTKKRIEETVEIIFE